jgi:hypothetical protein
LRRQINTRLNGKTNKKNNDFVGRSSQIFSRLLEKVFMLIFSDRLKAYFNEILSEEKEFFLAEKKKSKK